MSRKEQQQRRTDRHHLLFTRANYRVGYAHALRQHWYFIVEIPKKTLHAEIHHQIAGIPPPSGAAAKNAFLWITKLEATHDISKTDTAESRIKLLIELLGDGEVETKRALERQLGIIRNFYKKGAG